MSIRVSPEVERQLLERGIVGPPTVVQTDSELSQRFCAMTCDDEVMVRIPMPLPSLANTRMHWRAMAKVKKEQRKAVAQSLERVQPLKMPVKVTMTRFGVRKLDSDNLASAFKHVRDQIAEWMGFDDANEGYEWVCQQDKGKNYIEIKIESSS